MTRIRFCAPAFFLPIAMGISIVAAAQDEGARDRVAVQPREDETNQAAQPLIHRPEGTVMVPKTSLERPEDAGIRMHTNHLIFVPAGRPMVSPTPEFTFAETPASMGCVYRVGPIYAGCNPATGGTNHPSGGWGAIALVDAYDNPHAASDLILFSTYFGLPVANFKKVYANSSFGTLNGWTASCSGLPEGDVDWGLEEDLDIEWAHAMAPDAQIILVEACSDNNPDMFYAEQVAGIEVSRAGGGDISNSWSGGEFAGEVGSVDDVFYRYHPAHILCQRG